MGLYKRGDTWYIYYFHNGKRIRKAIGTKGDASRELTAIRARIDNRTFVPPREDSFDDLVKEYDQAQAKKSGYRTEKYYIRLVGEYFKGEVVQDIDVKKVEDFQTYLADLPKAGGGKRGGVDINHHMRVLRSIIQKAVLRDWITKNPADTDRVIRPSKGKGRTQYLEIEEVGRLLDACMPHLYPIVLCAVETGMRKSEVLGLRWSEIREVTLTDGRTAPMIFLPKERTKTSTARRVPVSAALNAELKRLKEAQTAPRVIALNSLVFRLPRPRKALRRDEAKPHLVTGPLKDIRAAWDAAKLKAGIDAGVHFHDLRRTFRTHMKRAHVDSFILNEIMGHANPKIEATYTQINNDQLVEAISLLPTCHKTATSEMGKVKGPEGRNPPALVFTGAEGGI